MITNKRAEILADELGDIDAEIKALEEQKAAVREELLPLIHDVPVVGLRWTVTKSETTSSRLDTKAVRDFLGDKADQFSKLTKSTTVRVKQTMVFGETAE